MFAVKEQNSLNRFLTKVFALMAGSVFLSGITAYLLELFVGASRLNGILNRSPWMWILILVVEMVLILVMPRHGKNKYSGALSIGLLAVFSIIEGATLSVILLSYSTTNITATFVAAGVDFGLLALYGLRTKKSLASWGRQLFIALLALIIVSVIDLFIVNNIVTWAVSIVGVVVFSLFTAYDTNQIKQNYLDNPEEANSTPFIVSAALDLYLDFINLFLDLLEIFGASDNNN